MSAHAAPWTDRPDVILRVLPRLDRHKDLLNIRWQQKMIKLPGRTSDELRKDTWANVLQMVRRNDTLKPQCLTIGLLMYSFEYDTLLDGEDHLRIQGAPAGTAQAAVVSDTQAKDLAGESYHVASLVAVIYAAYLVDLSPWWMQQHAQ